MELKSSSRPQETLIFLFKKKSVFRVLLEVKASCIFLQHLHPSILTQPTRRGDTCPEPKPCSTSCMPTCHGHPLRGLRLRPSSPASDVRFSESPSFTTGKHRKHWRFRFHGPKASSHLQLCFTAVDWACDGQTRSNIVKLMHLKVEPHFNNKDVTSPHDKTKAEAREVSFN